MIRETIVFILATTGMMHAMHVKPYTEFSTELHPSTIQGAGVGVFALHYMPAKTQLFIHAQLRDRRVLKRTDLPEMFVNRCIALDGENVSAPESFERMYIWSYLNHSATPNVGFDIQPDKSIYFYTLRDIEAGQELLVDYNNLNEPEECKEAYYKK